MTTKPDHARPAGEYEPRSDATLPDARAPSFEEDTSAMPLVRAPRKPVPNDEPSKSFNPYRFQAHTMPPGLRAELLAAKLPVVPPEDLQDTLPPNKAGAAAPALQVGATSSAAESTQGSLSGMDTRPSLRMRARGTRAVLVWTTVAILFGMALLYAVVSLQERAPSHSPASSSPRHDESVEPAVPPASSSPLVAAPPAPWTDTAEPSESSSAAPSEPSSAAARAPVREGRKKSRATSPASVATPDIPAVRELPREPDPVTAAPEPARSAPASTNPLDRLIVPPGKE